MNRNRKNRSTEKLSYLSKQIESLIETEEDRTEFRDFQYATTTLAFSRDVNYNKHWDELYKSLIKFRSRLTIRAGQRIVKQLKAL